MRDVGEATESGRVARAAGVLTLGASVVGVIWGLTLAIWTAVGTDDTGAGSGLPVRGWAGGLLIGLLCGAGTAVTLMVPVLMAAALTGSRLTGDPRRQRLAGLVVAAAGLAVAVGAQYWLVMDWSMVLTITWPAVLVALGLGALAGPFVVEGRWQLPGRGTAGS
ncbi:hypothetical protein [Acidipropionibacterium virtanenii]|uniref:hypothetical protein n=1 Tax=Acidipropionibacterium virtanenii TaxID=2057246 RepID=UPI0011BEE67F|nr:hypothetical protein [Acidipropionibacterium virtanenii]